MSDDRNFIDKTLSRYRNVNGSDAAPEDMAREFAKLGPADRVENLEMLEGEMREYSGPEEAAKYYAHVRAIRSTHEKLRKADR